MERVCIFCGASGALTREHVWPAWLSTLGLPNDPVRMETGPLNRLPDTRGPLPPLNMTVKSVCAQCNNGWMSELEKSVQPILASMILGRQTLIEPTTQPILAEWAFKTSIVSMLLLPPQDREDGRGLPPTEYTALFAGRKEKMPPAHVQAWIGHYSGSYPMLSTQVTPMVITATNQPAPLLPQAYVFTIVLGEALIQGVRFTDPDSEISLGSLPELAPIWPYGEPIYWPAGKSIVRTQLRDFQKGKHFRANNPHRQILPWDPTVNLPPSTVVNSMVRLPVLCGKHCVFYPMALVVEAQHGRFYRFMTACDCEIAYIIETEVDGARCKKADAPEIIAARYDALAGEEKQFTDHGGTFSCKRIPLSEKINHSQ